MSAPPLCQSWERQPLRLKGRQFIPRYRGGVMAYLLPTVCRSHFNVSFPATCASSLWILATLHSLMCSPPVYGCPETCCALTATSLFPTSPLSLRPCPQPAKEASSHPPPPSPPSQSPPRHENSMVSAPDHTSRHALYPTPLPPPPPSHVSQVRDSRVLTTRSCFVIGRRCKAGRRYES